MGYNGVTTPGHAARDSSSTFGGAQMGCRNEDQRALIRLSIELQAIPSKATFPAGEGFGKAAQQPLPPGEGFGKATRQPPFLFPVMGQIAAATDSVCGSHYPYSLLPYPYSLFTERSLPC